jgi:hypothetical protein
MWIFLRLLMLCILSGEIVVVEFFDIVYSSDGMKNSVYDGDCIGVSRCREFVYVLRCRSLEVNWGAVYEQVGGCVCV